MAGKGNWLGQIGQIGLSSWLDITPRATAARIANGATETEAALASINHIVSRAANEPFRIAREAPAFTSLQEGTPFRGYKRVASPKACQFCRMLAARGYIYKSKETAIGKPNQPYHLRCTCSSRILPAQRKKTTVKPPVVGPAVKPPIITPPTVTPPLLPPGPIGIPRGFEVVLPGKNGPIKAWRVGDSWLDGDGMILNAKFTKLANEQAERELQQKAVEAAAREAARPKMAPHLEQLRSDAAALRTRYPEGPPNYADSAAFEAYMGEVMAIGRRARQTLINETGAITKARMARQEWPEWDVVYREQAVDLVSRMRATGGQTSRELVMKKSGRGYSAAQKALAGSDGRALNSAERDLAREALERYPVEWQKRAKLSLNNKSWTMTNRGFNGPGAIAFSGAGDNLFSTILHEFGHTMQAMVPGLRDTDWWYWNRRVGRDRSVAAIDGAWAPSAAAKPTKRWYTLKWYSQSQGKAQQGSVSEVFTTGIQDLFAKRGAESIDKYLDDDFTEYMLGVLLCL